MILYFQHKKTAIKQKILLRIIIVSFFTCVSFLQAEKFKIASYNVENLFDLRKSGNEYQAYITGSGYGWDKQTAAHKYNNIAEVIADIDPHIIGLQEVESAQALSKLQKELAERNVRFPHSAIAEASPTTTRCALLSKFPITSHVSLPVGEPLRDILKVTLKIDDTQLVIYVNHWKSRKGHESLRIQTAEVLRSDIDKLSEKQDVILLGDLNSGYAEFIDITDNPELNNTGGRTGINHVLNTIYNGKLVSEKKIKQASDHEFFYNLWLELKKYRRWSYNFFGDKSALDHILIPATLYDEHGISYIDNSFTKFDPDYLFINNAVYRWQRAARGDGKHLGRGYSDHLPIYAVFSTLPYSKADKSQEQSKAANPRDIAFLYHVDCGRKNYRLTECTVIYKHKNNAIVKRPQDRAIFIYRAADKMELAKTYNFTVKRLKDFYGLREITELSNLQKTGQHENVSALYLDYDNQDLSRPRYQNEVLKKIAGKYKNGYLYYDDNSKIELYFRNNIKPPVNNTQIRLRNVRIGFHHYPQLIVEKDDTLDAAK